MLSERAKAIKPSATLAIDTKAKELKSQGIDVVGFGAGEPDFDTPENIKEAAIDAIKKGFTKYMPVDGIPELKDAVIEKFKRDNGLEYTRDEIIVSVGAKHALFNIALAMINTGDEVIIPTPYWVSYPEMFGVAGGIPVFVKTKEEENFALKPEAVEKAITKKTKILLINSPGNPSGAVYPKKDLEAIAEVVKKHNIFVVTDDIYEKLIYDGEKFSTIAQAKDMKSRTLLVHGVSKTYAMTGWRIGFTAGPKEIIKAMKNIQSQSTSNPTSIAMKASAEALRGPQDSVGKMVNEFDKRRKYLVDGLNKIKGIKCITPKGAFYAFPNISALYGKKFKGTIIKDSFDFADFLLNQVKVAVVPGAPFGAEENIRLSYATSLDTIKKGLERIEQAVSMLE
ncbi:MAG: pyridoxal phosphate-dependent aminotransferase [Deltaproteobacteria bacterium]|nr:pyridoxal phosphate-dependent aminotransferase [Deltaproteobacteria bacterium]MCL5792235.1 pyridoxal phosphate-dependent aminotransferase [Deltaproteobacteria bacterium]